MNNKTPNQLNLISNKILFTFLFFLCITLSFAQKNKNDDNHKSKITTTEAGVKYYLHTVEKGQTLFAIAKIYNKTVNDIVLENPEAIDGVKPSQVLKIPFDKPKPKEKPKETLKEIESIDSTAFNFHKVEKGETFYSITHLFKISEEKLKASNPELAEGLKVGQVIKIPKEKKQTDKFANDLNKKEIKKEIKKEKPILLDHEKAVPTDHPTAVKDTPTKNDSVSNIEEVYKSQKKEIYNIAFFLPFHAAEANTIELEKLYKGEEQFGNKTEVALEFYEGAMLAIDSLKKLKVNMKVFTYDIDEHDSVNIAALLKKPELSSMDLMIGPLYSSGFMIISKFAKEHKIPIVSPFIQVNKILFQNKYVCKVQPSISLQIEAMAGFVVDSFKNQNVILVDNGAVKDLANFNSFKNSFKKKLFEKNYPLTDTAKIARGLSGVESFLKTDKTNVVILVSAYQPYVTEFIRGLAMSSEKNKIVLFGLQSWTSFDNMDFDYLNKLQLHIPSNYFVDYSNIEVLEIVKSYRAKYFTDPDTYMFQGFDVSFFFISELYTSGTGFLQNITSDKFKGVESTYLFEKFPGESGFENKFVHILKYDNYKLTSAK